MDRGGITHRGKPGKGYLKKARWADRAAMLYTRGVVKNKYAVSFCAPRNTAVAVSNDAIAFADSCLRCADAGWGEVKPSPAADV